MADLADFGTFGIPEPFNTGFLPVDDIHKVYYEECGKSDGKPIIFVHGGPGGGIQSLDRCFFDPKVFRIILFDQRGSGKSTPAAELKNNTTWHLVEDMEKLRKHLGIEKWLLFGGSWGSTLSIAYAQEHTDRVKALILRGIFTVRKQEVDWLYQEGASKIFPDHWEKFIAPIPEAERGDILAAYYKRLTGDDENEKVRCAKEFACWECSTSKLLPDKQSLKILENNTWILQIARIERWPNSELLIIPDAGHSSREPGINTALLKAVDKYKDL